MSMFLSMLPQSVRDGLEALPHTIGRLQAKWPSAIELDCQSPFSVYDLYPYLFVDAFPSLNSKEHQEKLRLFALASRLFADAIFLEDHMIDQDPGINWSTAPLRVMALQFEAYNLLHGLYDPKSRFWEFLQQTLSDYAAACFLEQSFTVAERPWSEYTETLASQLAIGKSALARCVVAGLAELAGDYALLDPLTKSIDQYNTAAIFRDSVVDWKQDLPCAVPTPLLTRIFPEKPDVNKRSDLNPWIKQLSYEVYYRGHAIYILELACAATERAVTLTTGIGKPILWHQYLLDYHHNCKMLLDDLQKLVEKNLHRVQTRKKFSLSLPAALSPWQQLAWDSLTYLIHQSNLGFGEARHLMQFDFFGYQTVEGDVFPRAIIADALCDANETLNDQLRSLLTAEMNYLISQQDTFGVEGWRYFPNLPEDPPDADDLAQILQVLLRVGGTAKVKQHCEKPLGVLLSDDNRYPDGSFETWIIPAHNRTDVEQRQAEFVQTHWGAGPDSDVMANLLYALALYDRERFAEVIESGTNYLESQQQQNGSWLTTYYHGPYYGTYVCLRLLTLVRPQSKAIQSALNFLRVSQNSNGGWGIEHNKSDALSTALALLALATGTMQRYHNDESSAFAALQYLQQVQESDGGWPKQLWIRMDVGRAVGHVRYVLSYGSKSISTAYVLKAAIAWHHILSNN